MEELQKSYKEIEKEYPEINDRLSAEALMKRSGINVNKNKTVPDILMMAAQVGLISVIGFYEPLASLTVANQFGDTMLHFAAKNNQITVIKYLMLRGLDIRIQNKFNETAIFYAAEMGSIEIVTLLMKDKRTLLEH